MRPSLAAQLIATLGAIVCGAALVATPAESSALQSDDGAATDAEVTGEAAAALEEQAIVDWYMKEHGVSAERARTDLELQDASQDLRAKIWDLAGDNLADVGLEQVGGRLAVVAYVTKAADHDAITKLMKASGLPAQLVTVETPA